MPQDDDARRQHFLKEIEQLVQVTNREILNQRIPPITRENILPLVVSVARLRGNYLAEAFRVADGGEAPALTEIQALKTHRETYEEAKTAFEALIHAIERGYVDLDG
ncbi:MAG: hypothetical protein IIC04_05075 [Proteobacteria bacterium]|nr:hypothetical protein [Pseudomonadota bacterium]